MLSGRVGFFWSEVFFKKRGGVMREGRAKWLFFIALLMINTGTFSKSDNKWGYDYRYHNISKKIKSNTGILVIGYNRPDYFQSAVNALEKTPESQTLPFFFILDGGPNARQPKHCAIIRKSKIENKNIILRKTQYGCGRNMIDARRFMFEWCGFERIVLVEDDIVISPEYLTLVLNLHDWAKKYYDNVGLVNCMNRCLLSRKKKMRLLDVVEETYDNFWAYCIDRQCYNDIKDLLDEYEEKCLLLLSPKQLNSRVIAQWMKYHLYAKPEIVRERIFSSTIGYKTIFQKRIRKLKKEKKKKRDEQSVPMRFALFKAGYIKLSTHVNRGLYIGKEGVHYDEQRWCKNGYDKMVLDVFLDDIRRKHFVAS